MMHASLHQIVPASHPGRLPTISVGAHSLSQSSIDRALSEAQVLYIKEKTQIGLNCEAS